MRVELHNNLRGTAVDATRVLVRDQFGNIIVVAVEVEPGIILTETAANPLALNTLLRNLGLHETVIVRDVVLPSNPQIH